MGKKNPRNPAAVPIGPVHFLLPIVYMNNKFRCLSIQITSNKSKLTRKKIPDGFGWLEMLFLLILK